MNPRENFENMSELISLGEEVSQAGGRLKGNWKVFRWTLVFTALSSTLISLITGLSVHVNDQVISGVFDYAFPAAAISVVASLVVATSFGSDGGSSRKSIGRNLLTKRVVIASMAKDICAAVYAVFSMYVGLSVGVAVSGLMVGSYVQVGEVLTRGAMFVGAGFLLGALSSMVESDGRLASARARYKFIEGKKEIEEEYDLRKESFHRVNTRRCFELIVSIGAVLSVIVLVFISIFSEGLENAAGAPYAPIAMALLGIVFVVLVNKITLWSATSRKGIKMDLYGSFIESSRGNGSSGSLLTWEPEAGDLNRMRNYVFVARRRGVSRFFVPGIQVASFGGSSSDSRGADSLLVAYPYVFFLLSVVSTLPLLDSLNFASFLAIISCGTLNIFLYIICVLAVQGWSSVDSLERCGNVERFRVVESRPRGLSRLIFTRKIYRVIHDDVFYVWVIGHVIECGELDYRRKAHRRVRGIGRAIRKLINRNE